MNGESAMVIERPLLQSVPSSEAAVAVRQDPDLVRVLNEKTAIICGMADLLLEANGTLDQSVARAALDSIKRHAAALREVFQQD